MRYNKFKSAVVATVMMVLCTTVYAQDMTGRITNPSFETGDETGWTLIGKDPNGNDEFSVRGDYTMSGKAGRYLMNAYQWWAPQLAVSQTVTNLPSGEYELSAVVCTWKGRKVYLTANDAMVTKDGLGDQTGITAKLTVSVGNDQRLTISAGSTAEWWTEGHENETQTFFKLDNVRLVCKGRYLNGMAKPLPNDGTTQLVANQWYYFDADYATDYHLTGNINGMIWSTDGNQLVADVQTHAATREMSLERGRVYFRTSRSNATLLIEKAWTMAEGSFTAAALNVDGLPNKVLTIDLNPDGPGSEGTRLISRYLANKGYDIIGCSEDFNYNGSLMESLNDNYSCGTIRKTLSASGLSLSMLINGFRFDTDGLNLIWKNSTCTATNESWTQWDSMEKTDGNQYVKKGFRHYDLSVGEALFDLYILHMDAGDTNATASREAQWRQLAEAINAADHSRPKLILGDTNSRWTREDIKANFINRLSNGLMASDVWVEFYRKGIYPTTDMDDLYDQSDPANYTNYEIVDKVIYINPTTTNSLQLVPQSFCIEQDYTYDTINHDGDLRPLGDHRPVVVSFKYMRAAERLQFNDDEDGIQQTAAEDTKPADGAVYNLAGQRINTTATRMTPAAWQRGVYITRGRKMVVK